MYNFGLKFALVVLGNPENLRQRESCTGKVNATSTTSCIGVFYSAFIKSGPGFTSIEPIRGPLGSCV